MRKQSVRIHKEHMLTFFAALRQKLVSPLSLKLSVSAIIDDAETVGTDL
jgi:hypothetical protein